MDFTRTTDLPETERQTSVSYVVHMFVFFIFSIHRSNLLLLNMVQGARGFLSFCFWQICNHVSRIIHFTTSRACNVETHLCLPQLSESLKSAPLPISWTTQQHNSLWYKLGLNYLVKITPSIYF